MSTQKIILLIAVAGSFFAIISRNSVNLGFCEKSQIDCRVMYDLAEHIFYFFPVFLFLAVSSIILRGSWSYWWRFAKYAAPICFALVVAINFGVLHTTSYGTFGVGDMLNQAYDMWALSLVYGVFVIGSLIQIVRGYLAKPVI